MIVGTLITVLVSVIGLNKNVYKNRELFPLRPTTQEENAIIRAWWVDNKWLLTKRPIIHTGSNSINLAKTSFVLWLDFIYRQFPFLLSSSHPFVQHWSTIRSLKKKMFSAMIGRCIFATKSERIVAQK